MDFGVFIWTHHRPYKMISEAASATEELDFKSFFVCDHFFMPEKTYLETEGNGSEPGELDPWMALSAVATETEHIGLGTRVTPLPLYEPARLAKSVATLDIISGGRAILGAGAGWYEDAPRAYGIRWDKLGTRIDRMLEEIEIITRLWTQPKVTYEGKYYKIEDAVFFPKPVQKPHPPIWFGGYSNRILKAAAKMGNGYMPSMCSEEKFGEIVNKVKEFAREQGRDPSRIKFTASFKCEVTSLNEPDLWIEKLQRFSEKGADHAIILPLPISRSVECLRLFAQKVMPSLQ